MKFYLARATNNGYTASQEQMTLWTVTAPEFVNGENNTKISTVYIFTSDQVQPPCNLE